MMSTYTEIFPAYERPKMPQWVAPLMCLCLSAAIYLPRSTFNTMLSFPIVLVAGLNFYRFTSGDAPSDYTTALWPLFAVLIFLDRRILSSEHELEYVGRSMVDHRVKNKPASKTSGKAQEQPGTLSRLWNSNALNAFSLAISWRGIGYRWQVKGVRLPNRPILPRWKFVLHQLPRAVFYTAVTDVIGTVIAATADKHTWTLPVQQKLPVNLLLAWAMALWMGLGLLGAYLILGVAGVALGLTESWQWPDLFGDWSKCYRVRIFWSSSYHQLLRRMLQSPAVYLCRVLGLPKGSFASRYTQLYVVFALSGILHAAGSYNLLLSFDLAFFKCLDFQIMFAQAVAISFEDFVVWLWLDVFCMRARLGEQIVVFEKAVGFFWTFAWMTLTAWIFVDRQQRFGMMQTRHGSRNVSWVYLKPMIDQLKPI